MLAFAFSSNREKVIKHFHNSRLVMFLSSFLKYRDKYDIICQINNFYRSKRMKIASHRLPLPVYNGGAKNWSEFVIQKLEQGDTIHISELVFMMYGSDDYINRTRTQSFLSDLRLKLEKNGTQTLICRDGEYSLITGSGSTLEREEVVLRAMRVKSAARSHARVTKTFVFHNPDQKAFARKTIIDLDRELKILNAKLFQKELLLADDKNALSDAPQRMASFAAKSKKIK